MVEIIFFKLQCIFYRKAQFDMNKCFMFSRGIGYNDVLFITLYMCIQFLCIYKRNIAIQVYLLFQVNY